ncbi:hypothetical protein HD806DRAFT_552401 [Xylariaceae sp. AK1471]|nr:hypothetical protein HD806DRAFT_552401 [Xylariaceae sp. AK1471]
MSNVTATNSQLLLSGAYSDLILRCQGQEFRVHKNIVCSQSPVLATGLDVTDAMQEADTSTIEVNFDLTTLNCMLDFMYTGDYKKAPLRNDGTETGVLPDSYPVMKAWTPAALTYHESVNSIANHYGVMALAKLSANRIKALLDDDESFTPEAFCTLMRQIVDSKRDKYFQQVLVEQAAHHLPELVNQDIFSEGGIGNNMAAEVLKVCASHMKLSEVIQNKLAEDIMKEKERADKHKKLADSLERAFDELQYVLASNDNCRGQDCGVPFGCAIERRVPPEEERYLIRCKRCEHEHITPESDTSSAMTTF